MKIFKCPNELLNFYFFMCKNKFVKFFYYFLYADVFHVANIRRNRNTLSRVRMQIVTLDWQIKTINKEGTTYSRKNSQNIAGMYLLLLVFVVVFLVELFKFFVRNLDLKEALISGR